MCLTPLKDNRPKIARKPIKVYKMVRKIKNMGLMGPYMTSYVWTTRATHRVHPNRWGISLWHARARQPVGDGLHAFRNLQTAKRDLKGMTGVYGYNGYNSTLVIYEAEIPEGAQYILGRDSEIVSNELKLLRLVK